MPCPLPDGAAGGARVIRSDTVTVRQAESTWDPVELDRGFQLIDAALEYLFLGGKKVIASAASATIVVVGSAGRREGGFQIAKELFQLGVLGGGCGGDLGEGALDDLVAVRRGGPEVVKVRVKVVGEVGAVGKTGKDSERLGRYVEFDIVDGWGSGGCRERVLSSRDTRLALGVLVEGVKKIFPRIPRLVQFRLPIPDWAVIREGVGQDQGGRYKGG